MMRLKEFFSTDRQTVLYAPASNGL